MSRFTTRVGHPAFTDLPWDLPLLEWHSPRLVTPVRGISRHVVRFVAYGPDMYALKEIPDRLVVREYRLLRMLDEHLVPVVEAVGTATERTTPEGEELSGILITKHLSYSLPYRTLFAQDRHVALWAPLLDALAELLARIHLVGFFWGDCSLSNTLFRRDAGALAAYLVDAETGELHESLSDGQRRQDVDIAVENIFGELLDLQAIGEFSEDLDPLDLVTDLDARYLSLWDELTRDEVGPSPEGHWVRQRVERLNQLGYDVRELELRRADDGWHLTLGTCVMEQGHNARRLLSLTGLDVQENQARRLLNDIEMFRDHSERREGHTLSEHVAALRWLVEVFQPAVDLVPAELRKKLEHAELYHQILEHRWFMSEQRGHDVGLRAAAQAYVDHVLRHRPDERAVVDNPPTGQIPVVPPVHD
jgi:hypothetical protein